MEYPPLGCNARGSGGRMQRGVDNSNATGLVKLDVRRRWDGMR
ncbi:hypothetical protein M3J09_013085 [Ascochyta lentis]